MSFSDELRAESADVWEASLEHPFVRGIGDGSLPEDRFRFYVRQDYLFLIDYGRLLALGAARAPRLDWMRRFAALAHAVLETEMDLHRRFAAQWGITVEQLESERPAPATAAYCDFLLRTAALGDFAELVAALLPCFWVYQHVGSTILEATGGAADHPYRAWIQTYADEEFAASVLTARELVDRVAASAGDVVRRKMLAAFTRATEYEWLFWDSAWHREAWPTARFLR